MQNIDINNIPDDQMQILFSKLSEQLSVEQILKVNKNSALKIKEQIQNKENQIVQLNNEIQKLKSDLKKLNFEEDEIKQDNQIDEQKHEEQQKIQKSKLIMTKLEESEIDKRKNKGKGKGQIKYQSVEERIKHQIFKMMQNFNQKKYQIIFETNQIIENFDQQKSCYNLLIFHDEQLYIYGIFFNEKELFVFDKSEKKTYKYIGNDRIFFQCEICQCYNFCSNQKIGFKCCHVYSSQSLIKISTNEPSSHNCYLLIEKQNFIFHDCKQTSFPGKIYGYTRKDKTKLKLFHFFVQY